MGGKEKIKKSGDLKACLICICCTDETGFQISAHQSLQSCFTVIMVMFDHFQWDLCISCMKMSSRFKSRVPRRLCDYIWQNVSLPLLDSIKQSSYSDFWGSLALSFFLYRMPRGNRCVFFFQILFVCSLGVYADLIFFFFFFFLEKQVFEFCTFLLLLFFVNIRPYGSENFKMLLF